MENVARCAHYMFQKPPFVELFTKPDIGAPTANDRLVPLRRLRRRPQRMSGFRRFC